MQTRRTALLTIAGAAASPLFPSQITKEHDDHAMAEVVQAAEAYSPVFFKEADFAVVSRLADLILPRTETPGALDAHVPYRIDQKVAASPDLQALFQTGLQSLQSSNFLYLSEPQQVEVLRGMSDGEFFIAVKNLTVDWYYRSEEGLVKELGFHGNTFRADFPGCTHPEHWPSQGVK